MQREIKIPKHNTFMKTKILTLLFSMAAMVLTVGCNNDSGGGSLPGPQEFAKDYQDSALKLTLNNTLQNNSSQIVTLTATSENTVSLTLYNVFSGIPSVTMTGIGFEAFEKIPDTTASSTDTSTTSTRPNRDGTSPGRSKKALSF